MCDEESTSGMAVRKESYTTKQKCKNNNQTIVSLKNKINLLMRERDELRQCIDFKDGKIEDMKSSIDELRAANACLTTDASRMKKQLKSLLDEVNSSAANPSNPKTDEDNNEKNNDVAKYPLVDLSGPFNNEDSSPVLEPDRNEDQPIRRNQVNNNPNHAYNTMHMNAMRQLVVAAVQGISAGKFEESTEDKDDEDEDDDDGDEDDNEDQQGAEDEDDDEDLILFEDAVQAYPIQETVKSQSGTSETTNAVTETNSSQAPSTVQTSELTTELVIQPREQMQPDTCRNIVVRYISKTTPESESTAPRLPKPETDKNPLLITDALPRPASPVDLEITNESPSTPEDTPLPASPTEFANSSNASVASDEGEQQPSLVPQSTVTSDIECVPDPASKETASPDGSQKQIDSSLRDGNLLVPVDTSSKPDPTMNADGSASVEPIVSANVAAAPVDAREVSVNMVPRRSVEKQARHRHGKMCCTQ